MLDLGAGTGKLTRALVPRFARVIAVEPDAAMLDVLEEVVPEADARLGSGEAIPVEDAEVDAVFSAEAFHWFASGESVAEIARVLRPRGALVLLWNIGIDYDFMGPEAEAAIGEMFERGGRPGLGRVLSGDWRRPLETGFEELHEAEVERDLSVTRDQWIANMLSVGPVAHQPEEDRDVFAKRLRELVPAERMVGRRVRTSPTGRGVPERRLSFGSVAETYDRVRPPYSRGLLDRAQDALELGASARVLDLGAGTGRLHPGARASFRGRRRSRAGRADARRPRLRARRCREAIPLEDASVDGVFAGEAFHWFDHPVAIAEVARVLRPCGGLAIISTHWWKTEPPLPDDALELLREPYEGFRDQLPPPFDDAFAGSQFEPPHKEREEEAITVDADELLTLYSTTSSLAALGAEERDALFARVRPLGRPVRLPLKHELTWTKLAAVSEEILQVGRRRVRVTHPERNLFPGDGVTKGDLAHYYVAVADAIVPHLRDRPFTLKRYPHGIREQAYFHKQAPKGKPDWLRRAASAPGLARASRGSSTSRW